MAITTLASLQAAQRQEIEFCFTATRTSTASWWTSLMGTAYNYPAGTLAGTSTTTGVVPTDATAGSIPIESFNGNTGYITDVEIGNYVQSRVLVVDMLWKGGAYAFNANTSGQTPTSYSSRIPGGDYKGTEIWLEQVTTATGIQNVNVTYTNQDGTTGRSTGTVATSNNGIGRMWRLPLQSGDTGVQGVTGVVGSVATGGTFNILVLRPLVSVVAEMAFCATGFISLNKTLMPRIFDDSCLQVLIATTTGATNQPNIRIGIVSG